MCPEVEAGFGTPRESMRLIGGGGRPRLVTVKTGVDLTDRMERYSRRRVGCRPVMLGAHGDRGGRTRGPPHLRGADLGVAPIENVCLSYYFCSPNKLFEYINAGLPVVASDFPEMRQVIQRFSGWFTQ